MARSPTTAANFRELEENRHQPRCIGWLRVDEPCRTSRLRIFVASWLDNVIFSLIPAGLIVLSCGCRSSDSDPPQTNTDSASREKGMPESPVEVVGYRNASATFIDHDRYVFRSNRSGTFQVYLGYRSRPEAEPKQLTRFDSDVSFGFDKGIAVVPNTDRFVLLHRKAYYDIGLHDGSGDSPKKYPVRPADSFFLGKPLMAREVPHRFFFEVRRRSRRGVSLYEQALDEPNIEPKVILRIPDISGWVRDISPDGRYALITEFVSHTHWTLNLVDLRSGEVRRLYPASASANGRVTSARFSNDGKVVFAGTDGFRGGAHLVSLDLKGKVRRTYSAGAKAFLEIWCIAESPAGEYLALRATSGNKDRLIVLDSKRWSAKTFGPRGSEAGVGRIEGFAPDSRKLAFEWATPSTFGDLYILDVDRGATELLRKDRASVERAVTMNIDEVTIPSFDGTPIYLNIYKPGRARAGAKLPVIVHLHGGPNAVSRITWSDEKEFYIQRGFVVVEPNIRGSSGYGNAFMAADDQKLRLNCFRDIQHLGLWLTQQDWVDDSRMILSGASFGGYYALMGLALYPTMWRAGVSMYGISSWRTFFLGGHKDLLKIYRQEVGDIEHEREFLDSISPLLLADRITAPVFVYHGQQDAMVPWKESAQMADRLRSLGRRVEVMFEENEGHGIRNQATKAKLRSRLGRFLDSVR